MEKDRLLQVLESLQRGDTSVDAALAALQNLPFEDLGFAQVDHHRALRTGQAEVVYCPGKTPDQVTRILQQMVVRTSVVLATRADVAVFETVHAALPQAVFHATARAITVGDLPVPRTRRPVLVVSAGTSDIPVAEEAALTARCMGSSVETLFDVGVAGIHRLFHHRQKLLDAGVIVVVAGMEGALPSVVAGLVEVPVLAVPTSIGYGAHFGGVAPLLTMLNSCATGLAVVNIDNGFGAGHMAARINRMAERDA